jgi:hypothetical protein
MTSWLASWMVACTLAAPTPTQADGVTAAPKQAAPAVTLGASNLDKLAKMARGYYAVLDQEAYGKAKKEIDKLLEEVGKIAKAQKITDPMLALDDWRTVVGRGLMLEKPSVNISWRTDLRLATLPEELSPSFPSSADAKDLQGVFDNKLKAFVSLPVDYAKVAYPVILALHPEDGEVRALKDMKKSKAKQDEVLAWAHATYSKEILAKAIVVVPIMDLAIRSADGVSFTRPRWDTDEGAAWAFKAVSQIVFPNVNHDPRRIFLDGSGSAAIAALAFCAQFPGLQTGAIVRGEPPQKIAFENCAGTPILFVGAPTQSFFEEWKGKDGFVLEQKESIDDATLLQWMADHPKDYSPDRIHLQAERIEFASSYWLKVTDEDRLMEKLPIVLDAVVDREKNQITVVTNEKVKGFEIYLNDEVLDLSKELRVLHRRTGSEPDSPETERFKGVLKRGVEDTLRWAYTRPYCNTGEVYVALIPVELN